MGRARAIGAVVGVAALALGGFLLLLDERRESRFPAAPALPPPAGELPDELAAPEDAGEPPYAARMPAAAREQELEVRTQRGEKYTRGVGMDWDLLVEVVDDALHPAARVPVYCTTRARPNETSERTDVQGRILFRNAGSRLARAHGRPLRVGVDLPLADKLEALVEREPPEPVRLRLPPLGSLEVLVVDPSGEPIVEDTLLEVQIVRTGEPREHAWFAVTPSWQARPKKTDGCALFERVGIGLGLELSARPFDGPERAQAFIPGPRFAGERVAHTLQLALDRTALVFRAVDERGRPVVGELYISIGVRSSGYGSSLGTGTKTDEEGKFEVVVGPFVAGDERELRVTARERWSGRLELDRPFPPGRIDMGDLVLAPSPLIAQGRAIDTRGNPVHGARIQVSTRRGEDGGGVDLTQAVTDRDGAFAARGSVHASTARLELFHDTMLAAPLEVPVGSSGIEIVAYAGGGIDGSVLLDPGVPPDALLASVRLDDGSDRGGRPDVALDKRQGTFSLEGLLAGTYTLFVVTGGREVLAEVPGIAVRPGEITRDPRIQGIDLRGRIHVFELTLVPPSPGFELTGGTLRFQKTGTHGSKRVRGLGRPTEPVKIVTPLARIDVTVRVDGCRVEDLTDLPPRTEVRLRPGIPVRLVLSADVALPGPPLFLGAGLESTDGTPGAEAVLFDARGELLCRVREPGRMKVVWCLERRDAGAGGRSQFHIPPEQLVLVEDQDVEQRIELQITNDQLQAALADR